MWWTVLSAVLAVFAVVGVGAILRRLNWLTEEADRSLMDLIVRLLIPCLILHSVIGNSAFTNLGNVLWPPVLGYASVLLGMVVAVLWLRLTGSLSGLTTAAQRRTFVLTVGVYNYKYIPIPLAALLFPKDTMGVLLVFAVAVELAQWTAGVMVLTGGLEKGWWKRLINGPSVAVVLALLIHFAALGLGITPRNHPHLVQSFSWLWAAMGWLGQCAIPMSLLLVGATAADHLHGAKWLDGGRVIAAACLLRLGLAPALFIALALLPMWSLDLKRVLVLEAAMPAAMFPIVIAKYYHGDSPTALRVVIGTSLVSLLTIPAWLLAGLKFLEWLGR